MILGCIADDFTGAADIANTLSKAGMRVRLFFGPIVESFSQTNNDFDAAVIGLKSRSIESSEAVRQSLDALRWLQEAGARQIVFKYCSTFDSTPAGNIGPVAEALADALDAFGCIICPSFPQNKRTVYQGHLFVGDQLLNESGMQDHPVTPMRDADIRRWLQRQSSSQVAHIALETVKNGAVAIGAAISRLAAAKQKLIVIDAVADEDLLAIGRAVKGAPLVTGGSAIAMGLPANFDTIDLSGGYSPNVRAWVGPGLVLAGSCSTITLKQVETYAKDHPSFPVDVQQVLGDSSYAMRIAEFVEKHCNDAPIIFSSGTCAQVRKVQEHYGSELVSGKIEKLFVDIAIAAMANGLKRLVIAGGETSGAVIQGLGLTSLDIGPEIASGVPSLHSGLEEFSAGFALKSGNFGNEEFFARALQHLENGNASDRN